MASKTNVATISIFLCIFTGPESSTEPTTSCKPSSSKATETTRSGLIDLFLRKIATSNESEYIPLRCRMIRIGITRMETRFRTLREKGVGIFADLIAHFSG